MKMKSTKLMTAIFLMAVAMLGCKKPVETKVPMVTLLENALEIGHNTAVLYAEVTDDGGAAITERGFCFGKADGSVDTLLCEESGPFSVELTDLTPLTAYKCRAFAGNVAGRGFSSEFSFTTETDTVPRVKTFYVREITHNSAVASGQVLGSGGQTVMERGICYGLEPMPTVNNTCLATGSGVGPFDCTMTGLTPETVYYIRAYAKCTKGVYYGSQLFFSTNVLPMEVRTLGISEVIANRAYGEGEVIRDGGCEVTDCGFCWSTEHNPTIEDLHARAGYGVGTFSFYFSGFERGRTHYMRAYAINEKGVVYGEEVEFLPDDSFVPWPDGTLPGLFSVAPDRQVRFSQGNLQLKPDARLWRFAERQWDFVGGKYDDPQLGELNIGTVYSNGVKCDNTKMYANYDGWMDLYGWGTSGWNHGNVYYRPYDHAAYVFNCDSYGPYGNHDLTGDYAEADWGIHNTISNGGSRQWRTPTSEEIKYLIDERETPSGMRFAKALICGIPGMIILPDDWNASVYPLNDVNMHSYYSVNTISGNDWTEVLEPAGAVFLPASGERYQITGYDGIIYGNVRMYDRLNVYEGGYWTTTQGGVNVAHALLILSYGQMEPRFIAGCIDTESLRCNGCSVRLISDER